MKPLLKLFFVLMPFIADSQGNKSHASPIVVDSIAIPPVNREWTVPEFVWVFERIVSLQNTDSLDVISIDNNKEFFAKLTEIRNYPFFMSKEFALKDRLASAIALLEPVKMIFRNYFQKSKIVAGKLSFDREIAAFWELIFGMTQMLTELADEFVKTNPNLSQIQLGGLEKMIKGFTTMEAGGLITLESEYALYSEPALCQIASSFSSFYSFMYLRIDEDSRSDFDARMAKMMESHPVECVRNALKAKYKNK
ncbi:MAG: hypothetical protein DI535_15665 [Citrobacter freundii]|nr:MAG: hypothetical protein DI535_15665 [Citrobacter freundii]